MSFNENVGRKERERVAPDERRVVQLQHDDETETDEQQAEIEEQHQAAAAARVGAERVRCPHRLDDDAALLVRLGPLVDVLRVRRATVRPIRALTANQSSVLQCS